MIARALWVCERLLLIGGVGLCAFLIYELGADTLLANLRLVGWGIVPIVLQEILAYTANAAGWLVAFPKPRPAIPPPTLFAARLAGSRLKRCCQRGIDLLNTWPMAVDVEISCRRAASSVRVSHALRGAGD